MILVSQVSGLVKNCKIGIISDVINVINVKLCMMVLLTELSMTLTIFQGHSNVQYL